MSLNGLLQVSRDTLSAYQTAIGVTGGNISNVNTPGYTRQRVVFNSVGNVQTKAVGAQLSVEVSKVERVMSSFLETQLVDQSQNAGYSESENNMLQRVETVFDETSGTGLSDTLGRFWGSWEDMTLNPQGQLERGAVLSAAQNLVEKFNYVAGELDNVRTDASSAIKDAVSQVNSITKEIAGLNKSIIESGATNGETNQLMDKRMEALKSLGKIIDFNYIENANGTVDVFLPDGNMLVTGNTAKQLEVDVDQVVLENSAKSMNDALSANKKGSLGALINMRDTIIPDYTAELDALASTIVEQVNTQHKKGFDSSGVAGVDFFYVDPAKDTTARNISISTAVEGDLDKIAASSSATASGDGENARTIAALKDDLLMNSGKTTFGRYYSSVVGQIARDISESQRNSDHNDAVLQQLTNQRDSMSGVSVDEEMMNILKYQMGYNAAGRLCQTVNEMMDTLMSLGQ